MEEETVHINEDATIAYLAGSGSMVNLNGGIKASTSSSYPGKELPTTPVERNIGSSEVAYWGDDNLFPQTVVEECSKNTIIPTTLGKMAALLYGAGLMYGTVDSFDADGNGIFTRIQDPKIDRFFKLSNIKRYLRESISDFYWFFNVFPELILTKNRKEIVSIGVQEATYSRWGRQNENNGLIDTCYINANWGRGGNADNSTKVAVIDPYYDPVAATREGSEYKYIYPVSFPTPGKTYYQLAHWNSLRESGWLDVAKSIPAFKKALFKNQISIKYHIVIDREWWNWKYKDFETLEQKDRIVIMKAELEAFEKTMAGDENAGKTIMSTSFTDPDGKVRPGWTITPIDNKIASGVYIEDSQEASSHLLYALGVDPTLIGQSPGKGMGAGSGSDKRVAFNVYSSLCEMHRDLILEPLYFIRDFNGWGDNIEFRFRYPIITTLDKGKETQQQAS